MKNENDNTYNRYIEKLKQFEPNLENPTNLTHRIIHEIKNQESLPQPIFKRSLFILRPLLSTAAVFLFALFIYQFYDVPAKSNSVAIIISKPTIPAQKSMLSDNETFVEDSFKQKIIECFNDTVNIDCFSEAVTYYNLYKENARQTFKNKFTNYSNKNNYEIN